MKTPKNGISSAPSANRNKQQAHSPSTRKCSAVAILVSRTTLLITCAFFIITWLQSYEIILNSLRTFRDFPIAAS